MTLKSKLSAIGSATLNVTRVVGKVAWEGYAIAFPGMVIGTAIIAATAPVVGPWVIISSPLWVNWMVTMWVAGMIIVLAMMAYEAMSKPVYGYTV